MSKAPKDLNQLGANRHGRVCSPFIRNPTPQEILTGDDLKAYRAKRKAQRLARKKAR